jgi:hypothetical protein
MIVKLNFVSTSGEYTGSNFKYNNLNNKYEGGNIDISSKSKNIRN